MLLSHCRTMEKAAQQLISALQKNMAERQVSHSRKMQALTEVESSQLFWSLLISNKHVCKNLKWPHFK